MGMATREMGAASILLIAEMPVPNYAHPAKDARQ